MGYAIYNRQTNKVKTFVNKDDGNIPNGYEFVEESLLPDGWLMEERNVVSNKDIIRNQALLFLQEANASGLYDTNLPYIINQDGEVSQSGS